MRSAAIYTAGSLLGILGSVLRVGMAARLLPRDVAGAWLGLQLVLAYAANLHLGVIFGMFRNAPMLRAAGDTRGAADVERTTFTFMLVVSAIGATCIAMGRWLLPPSAASIYLPATGVLVFVTVVKSYFVTRLKGESAFVALSASAGLGSVVSVATLGLIFVSGLSGLIAGMIAQAVVETAYLVRHAGVPRLGIRLPVLKDQLAVGFPTLLVAAGNTLLTTIDRTVMLQRLGASTTGLYYLGANIVTLVPLLFGMATAVLTPRFFERFARNRHAPDLMSLVEEPLRITGVLVGAVLGVGAIALPAAVARLWPQLAPANAACYFAVLAAAPIVLSGMVTNVFYALNRQVQQLLILGAGAAVTYALASVGAILHPGLASVAAGSFAGLCLFYVGTAVASYRLMGARASAALLAVGRSLLPTTCAALLVVGLTLTIGRIWPPHSIPWAVASELVFLTLSAPWVSRALRRLRAK